jgi:hypothetical protein
MKGAYVTIAVAKESHHRRSAVIVELSVGFIVRGADECPIVLFARLQGSGLEVSRCAGVLLGGSRSGGVRRARCGVIHALL